MKYLNLTLCTFVLFLSLNTKTQTKPITLEDIYKNYTFSEKGINVFYSMNDGEHYTVLEEKSIKKYNFKTGELVSVLLDKKEIEKFRKNKPLNFSSYQFNADETKILIPFDSERIYRRSRLSNFVIYDLNTKSFYELCPKDKQILADFSPDGTKVAYLQENNIYVKDLESGKTRQITTDGKINQIINGGTDWVYEEEFSITKGFYWSPNGNKIAFYRFNESRVKEYTMLKYGEVYPDVWKFKYPVAGEDNSIIEIKVYDFEKNTFTTMDIGSETGIYIPRITWSDKENELFIFRLNRLQQKLDLLKANTLSGKSEIVYQDQNKRYISENVFSNYIFFDNSNKMAIFSERSGFNHIYCKDFENGKLTQLTTGNFDVMNLLSYNSKKKEFYFLSAESSPMNRDFCTVNLKGKQKRFFEKEGSWDIEFTKDYHYFISYFSEANTPSYIRLHKIDGKVIRVLEDNADLKQKIKEYGFGKKEFFCFKTSEGVELNAYKMLPVNFDPAKKYAVMMYVYGGPGSQTVTNEWTRWNAFFSYLNQLGIIVVSVDNRGTGARGEEFKKITYGELGKYETIDQVEGAKYLASLPYVDQNNISIFGWSYGGWMSSLCLTSPERVFSTAVSVAPVTHYYYYDNIWTERYMGLPQNNKSGYEDNAVLNMAQKIEGNLLLIHGSGDDNVHPQNTYDFITALVEANKQFDLFIYPNKNHSITGGQTQYHLFTKISNFLKEHLLNEKE